MRPLGPRDCRRRRSSSGSGENWLHLDLQALAMQTQAGMSLVPSGPVSPEKRSRSHCQRMEQHAHLTRFGCGAPAPLALLPQRTRTTIANAGSRDHPQTAISFSTAFKRDQCVACGTPQGPIGLERKVSPGEATSFPGGRGGRWSRARGGCGSCR
jgi:hypothetical protein